MALVSKAVPALIGMAGSAVASKGAGLVWKGVTGKEPPVIGPDSEDTLRNALIWSVLAAVTGTVVSFAIARAQRRFFS